MSTHLSISTILGITVVDSQGLRDAFQNLSFCLKLVTKDKTCQSPVILIRDILPPIYPSISFCIGKEQIATTCHGCNTCVL